MNHPYNSKEHWQEETYNNDSEYKSFIFFKHIGTKFDLPTGCKVQLGVGNGYTLNAMKQHWGVENVIGIDLYNLNNDPNVFTVNIKHLKVQLPCAYIENDIGSTAYPESKEDRWYATQWAVKCLIPGGIFITSPGHMIEYPVEQYALDNNCTVTSLTEYNNESWAQHLNEHTTWKTTNWCIISKNI